MQSFVPPGKPHCTSMAPRTAALDPACGLGCVWKALCQLSSPPPPTQSLHFLLLPGQHQIDYWDPDPCPRVSGESINLDVPHRMPCAPGNPPAGMIVPGGLCEHRRRDAECSSLPRLGLGGTYSHGESNRCTRILQVAPSLVLRLARPTGRARASAQAQPCTWCRLHRTFLCLGSDQSLPQHDQSLTKPPSFVPGTEGLGLLSGGKGHFGRGGVLQAGGKERRKHVARS